MGSVLRAKFKCNSIRETEGSREVSLSAVYGKDGSANAQWSKWTPAGSLTMTINNEAAFNNLKVGHEYYLDFTEAEPEQTPAN